MTSDDSRSWKRFTRVVAPLVILATFAVAFAAYGYAENKVVDDASRRLQLFMELRKALLKQYLESMRAELVFWGRTPQVQQRLVDMSDAWRAIEGDPGKALRQLYIEENRYPSGNKVRLDDSADGLLYSDIHAQFHPGIRQFLEQRGYYDVFLIDAKGNVLYTASKETDFATNLSTGPWRDTGLAKAFRAAMDGAASARVGFADFSAYPPSNGAPQSFIAIAVYERPGGGAYLDEREEPLGVLALQLPIDRIVEFMQFTAGMGKSGETYLVGEDRLMRSESRFFEESTILVNAVETQSVERALEGRTGVDTIRDYRGVPVLSAYGPLLFEGVTWAVIAEIDKAEVQAAVWPIRNAIIAVSIVVVILLTIAGVALASSARRT